MPYIVKHEYYNVHVHVCMLGPTSIVQPCLASLDRAMVKNALEVINWRV